MYLQKDKTGPKPSFARNSEKTPCRNSSGRCIPSSRFLQFSAWKWPELLVETGPSSANSEIVFGSFVVHGMHSVRAVRQAAFRTNAMHYQSIGDYQSGEILGYRNGILICPCNSAVLACLRHVNCRMLLINGNVLGFTDIKPAKRSGFVYSGTCIYYIITGLFSNYKMHHNIFSFALMAFVSARLGNATPVENPSVNPFKIDLSSEVPRMLKLVKESRLPDKPEYPGLGSSFGIDLDVLKDLKRKWVDDFDWNKEQEKLNK